MERIRQSELEYLVKRINELTHSPLTPYIQEGGKFTANIGNYHLDYAYGGVKLVRMVGEGGGITEASEGGYGTKRELYYWMRAYIAGYCEAPVAVNT